MLRVYLTSRVRLEDGEVLVDERALPGRQGRLILAYLVAERARRVSRDELAAELWNDDVPPAWDKGLMAIISKLRTALRQVGLPSDALETAYGGYQLRLPSDTWVDIEAAAAAVHEAETLLAGPGPQEASPWAFVAYFIGRRPFLPGEDGPWASRKRAQLRELYLRALDCCVVCNAATGGVADAVQAAEDALTLEPIRESTYQLLMRVHADTGNRAEALRVYERCRRVLDDELGVPPSAETRAVHAEILKD